MARAKPRARRPRPLVTWTRFHLPLEQELPTWPVNVHHGPLADVSGAGRVSLGRMVESPEQAAYIIEWATLDDLKNFQASPACAEFLRNLPEHRNLPVSIESGAALEQLAMDDAPSRFLTFECATQTSTEEVKGRVTITTFVVPHKANNGDWMFSHYFKSVFGNFAPDRFKFIARSRYSWIRHASICFQVLAEDRWVEEKFGKLERTEEENSEYDQGRTLFCHFLVWPLRLGAVRADEEALAADPRARESWNQQIAQVMPPATAWTQERWDIRAVLRPDPSEDEVDPEWTPYDIEQEEERRRLQAEYRQLHPPEFDQWLNPINQG